MREDELLAAARLAREAAYAPYSGFAVGAALLGKSGRIHKGCNIENASYGATICAERVAAAKAISEGERSFIALAVTADAPAPVAPCGLCRQFLAEFTGGDMLVLLDNMRGETRRTTLAELLPEPFGREQLPPAGENGRAHG